MTEQILDLLPQKSNKITFKNHLKSIGAKVVKVTNPYESARFVIQGKVCVIYYKQKRGIFSYSCDFAKAIHRDWIRGGKIRCCGGVNKETDLARKKTNKLLGNLMRDKEFVRYINQEFDGRFDIQYLNIDELRIAYKCILQYRRIWLKEEVLC